MTVGHEIGHLVLHSQREYLPSGAEDEADEFAAELLMPEAAMRELVTPLTLTRLAALKPKWRISIQALIVRAKQLEIVSERQYRYLFEQIGIQGWRTIEPENLAVEPERPRALRQLAELFYGNAVDTKKLAKAMAMPEALVKQVISQYREKRSAEPEGTKVSAKIVLLRR